MRLAVYPLIFSAALHLLGFLLMGFAAESVFLLFPAGFYCLLSALMLREVIWAAWLTLICMIGGITGTVMEFAGPVMAPSYVLIGIIGADAVTALFLLRGLWLRRGARDSK